MLKGTTRTLTAALVAGLITVILVAGCGGENNAPPAPTTGSVTGRVIDQISGLGMGGVQISIAGRTDTTDQSGGFEVVNVPAGTYNVVITPPAGLALPPGSPTVVVQVFAGQNSALPTNIVVMDEGDVPPDPPH